VTAGGKQLDGPHQAWIADYPFRGDVRVMITEPQDFERYVAFAMNEEPFRNQSQGARDNELI